MSPDKDEENGKSPNDDELPDELDSDEMQRLDESPSKRKASEEIQQSGLLDPTELQNKDKKLKSELDPLE